MGTLPKVVTECLVALDGESHVAGPWTKIWRKCIDVVRANLASEKSRTCDLDYVIQVCTSEIQQHCEERFLIYPYSDVPDAWRTLRTDSALLGSCAALLQAHYGNVYPPSFWLARIRDLDMALITCSPSSDRARVVYEMIAALQSKCPTPSLDESREQPTKRRRRDASPPPHLDPRNAAHPIPELNHGPTLKEFLEFCPSSSDPHDVGRPFVLRGYARDWPALHPASPEADKPRWSDASYLNQRAGPGRVVPVEKGAMYTDANWGQTILPFAAFLEQIGWDRDTAAPHPLYLAQHTLLTQFPWLSEDMRVPPYVSTRPPAPAYAAAERGARPSAPIASVWIGPKKTVSAAHTDPYFNCFVQVHGTKSVWIAPPHANDGGAMRVYGTSNDTQGYTHLMSNTSQVDVFSACPPPFVERVAPHAMHTQLEAGDLLFLPPHWWHAMQSASPSFSVSFWF